MKKNNGDFQKCLVPECDQSAYTRGLCISDYKAARYLVKTGKTTWLELEKKKKILLPTKAKSQLSRQEYFLK